METGFINKLKKKVSMNDKFNSEQDILSRLESFTKERNRVSYREFEQFLQEVDSSLSPNCLYEILNFSCEQLGFWESEWFFSPVNSPNTQAEIEMEGWKILWSGLFDTVVESTPITKELLESNQNLKLLQHTLVRGVEYNKTKSFRKILAPILSEFSFILNKIGLHGFARVVYGWGLFPKGTIGRP